MLDIHVGLQTERLTSHTGGGVEFTLAKVTHGRDQVAYGLHASVHSHSLGGVSSQDFLEHLGFRLQDCPFTSSREAYCVAVDEGVDAAAFAEAFGAAFDVLRKANGHLERCGFYLESRDFPAKAWARGGGDGHTGTNQRRMKESRDEHFEFVFSWLEQDSNGGWTTHYRATERPQSAEMEAVLDFLGLDTSEQCAEFDFERCRWRHVRRDTQGDPTCGNNDTVGGWFEAHPEHFAAGIEDLLTAEGLVRPFGMSFLQPAGSKAQPALLEPAPAAPVNGGGRANEKDYDVATRALDAQRASLLPRLEGEMGEGSGPRTMVRASPTAFISYSWDTDEHRAWVRKLAERIRGCGVDVKLDQWETAPGDQLTEFMERGIRDHDFVVIICTPKYRQRSDSREGGVGYEGDVMTAEVMTNGNERKFIPVWRSGQWEEAAPSWLVGKYYIDLSGNPYDEERYADLIETLRGERLKPPPISPRASRGVALMQQRHQARPARANRDRSQSALQCVGTEDRLRAWTYWRCFRTRRGSVGLRTGLEKHASDCIQPIYR